MPLNQTQITRVQREPAWPVHPLLDRLHAVVAGWSGRPVSAMENVEAKVVPPMGKSLGLELDSTRLGGVIILQLVDVQLEL